MNYDEAKKKWEMYSKAENQIVSGGQSYAIEGRQMTKADLSKVREGLDYWEQKLKQFEKQSRQARIVGGL